MRISEFRKLTARQRASYDRALEALHLMRREGRSLRAAAREVGVDPRTVSKYIRPALRRDPRTGEWRPKPQDNLPREVRYTTPEGRTETVLVRGSQEARKVADWQSAVLHFQRTGDDRYLRRLRYRTFVDAHGKRHRLPTDPAQIEQLSETGQLDVEEVQTP
jgi:hypothetical protein